MISLRRLAPWAAPAGLVLAWGLLARVGTIPPSLFPAPLDVMRAAVEATRHGSLLTHLGVSALRAFGGLLIGATIGLTLGLATGLSRSLQLVFDGPLQMLRAVPALALVPLVILWFGIGETAKLFIVALGLSWLVLIIAESIGATQGLGHVAMNAREFMQMDLLVLTIVLWALLGKLADVLARRLETLLLPWQPRMQRMAAE